METIPAIYRQFPAPSDRTAKPLYTDYIRLQQEIIKLWKQDVANGRLGQRGYVDLNDCRLTLQFSERGHFVPVISLTPPIAPDLLKQLTFYRVFFILYNALKSLIVRESELIRWQYAQIAEVDDLLLLEGSDAESVAKIRKTYEKNLPYTRKVFATLVSILNEITLAALANKLPIEDLDTLLNLLNVEQFKIEECGNFTILRRMVLEYGNHESDQELSRLIPEALVSSFHRWANNDKFRYALEASREDVQS